MADNDEKGDHREPATLVERAASAGVDVAERFAARGRRHAGTHLVDGLDTPDNELDATSVGYGFEDRGGAARVPVRAGTVDGR